MAIDRSIERDYDINYHTRAARKSLEETLAHLKALSDIGYEPWATTATLDEMWKTWKDELDITLY